MPFSNPEKITTVSTRITVLLKKTHTTQHNTTAPVKAVFVAAVVIS